MRKITKKREELSERGEGVRTKRSSGGLFDGCGFRRLVLEETLSPHLNLSRWKDE